MISFQQMHYILSVNDYRHFQRASEACFVTQPTLSMQIKKAEDDLGYQIFDRSTNPLTLTAFGEKLVVIIREIINETEKISKLTKSMSGTFIEKVRLGVIPTIAAFLISDMFDKWKSILPNIQLTIEEMKSEELVVALEKKEIDIAIMAGPFNQPNLRTIPLFKEEIKAYIPSIHSETIYSNDLIDLHPWLLSKGNCLRTQMIHFCGLTNDKDDSWNYEGGNLEMLLRMVDVKGGYSLVPEEYQRVLNLDNSKCKRIISSENNEIPAREIISIFPNKTSKWESIEKIVRSIQLNYGKDDGDKKYQVLNWK
jgi:LysR family hydrogen peroxide-inducible transcriptional activator